MGTFILSTLKIKRNKKKIKMKLVQFLLPIGLAFAAVKDYKNCYQECANSVLPADCKTCKIDCKSSIMGDDNVEASGKKRAIKQCVKEGCRSLCIVGKGAEGTVQKMKMCRLECR